MKNHKIRWEIASRISPEADDNLLAYPPFFRQILYNRGIVDEKSAEIYLRGEVPAGHDPFILTDMERTVQRIQTAIDQNERIAVYGDYDVDGVTATALLVEALKIIGADVIPYIPNRFEEGYGLNTDALDSLYSDGVGLVITVDCGIRSWDEVSYAQRIGLDLIITDHHGPLGSIPEAFAVINPKREDDLYPDKDLAGVGIAYKLVQALSMVDHRNLLRPVQWLDLVAIGTVADLAPLIGENRGLVRRGLELLREGRRPGLVSLANIAGISIGRASSIDIGFVLGPRLNAAGRLESALAAYELLVAKDIYTAAPLAQKLDDQNRQRQQATREIQETAEAIAVQDEEIPFLIFAADPAFNPGVVGLAASRLAEMYYRPSIVVFMGEEYSRGSCRSIPEFHITRALDECNALLVRHGGHAAAAGFTVRTDTLPKLVELLSQIAKRELQDKVLEQVLYADLDIRLSELRADMLPYLDMLQPTGYGNQEPIFASFGVKVRSARTVGREGKHLKLTITDGLITYDAIAFRMGYLLSEMPGLIDILYRFEINEYMGRQYLQLNLLDLKPAGRYWQ